MDFTGRYRTSAYFIGRKNFFMPCNKVIHLHPIMSIDVLYGVFCKSYSQNIKFIISSLPNRMEYAADIFPFEAAAHLSAVLSVMEGGYSLQDGGCLTPPDILPKAAASGLCKRVFGAALLTRQKPRGKHEGKGQSHPTADASPRRC